MDIFELMRSRHSVRNFTAKPLEDSVVAELNALISECNASASLNIQLCLNEPEAFKSILAKYGRFKNVNNYIALVAKKEPGSDEKLGYYGEKLVLKAQELGLRTCWVGGSYSKGKAVCAVNEGEKLYIVIALGYSDEDGIPHKNKSIEKLCRVDGVMPDWFRRAMEAAMLAPTAINQQSFTFTLKGNKVCAKAGLGPYAKLDLGIVKLHFELGAGDADWSWAE